MSRWEHVDLDAGTWLIMPENVKGHIGEKTPQTAHLFDFARRQFKALHEITAIVPGASQPGTSAPGIPMPV